MNKKILCGFMTALLSISGAHGQQLLSARDGKSGGLPDDFVVDRIDGGKNPEGIPDSDAILFFSTLLANADGAGAEGLMAEMNLRSDRIADLKRIAGSTLLAVDRANRAGLVEVCRSSEYLRLREEQNYPAALVALMTNLESDTSAASANLFRSEISRSFGEAFYVGLMTWMDEAIKPKITSVKIDHVARAKALNKDLFLSFESICR